MGPNEVQALIGQWVDGHHDRDRWHHHHHHQQQQQQQYGQPPYGPPLPQQPPYGPPYQQPLLYGQPLYQQQPARQPVATVTQQPYQQPLPASAYRQTLPPHRAHIITTPSTRSQEPDFLTKAVHTLLPITNWLGADLPGPMGPPDAFPFPARAAVVNAPMPTQANRDILPMSTGVPILPTQSAQITGRPQTLVFKIGRFVISNAGTAGGAADWIVNDIKIGNRSQFVQSGDVPGDLFAVNAIDTFVRFEAAQTAMDVVVVVTYIGLNESGAPFFGAMVGTAAV
jgi:hypothetical protein